MVGTFHLRRLSKARSGNAATEMALVLPFMVALMFGSAELGNYFLDHHAVAKQVRDGARYGSRLKLSASYNCSGGTIFEDGQANTKIINVTKTGSVDGTAAGRFAPEFWTACTQGGQPVTVTVRCVAKGTTYAGLYSGVAGDIPVIKVSAAVDYPSILGSLGFSTAGVCVRAESEAAVMGI